MDDADAHGFSGVQHQMELYRSGFEGRPHERPVGIEALEERAKAVLPREAYDYVAGGAGSEATMRANLDAFGRWRIVPRVLRDVGRRDLSVDVLGRRLPAPFLFAPVGVQSI